MIFKSKRTVAGLIVAVILFIGYLIYAMGSSAPAADDLEGWALLILKFIAVCVVAEIMVHVIIHAGFAASIAVREGEKDENTIKRTIKAEMTEDEMDTNIMLRSSHAGYGVAGVGFIIMLVAIAFFGASAVLALNLLLGIFFISVIVDSSVSIYLYERGGNGWTSGRGCR